MVNPQIINLNRDSVIAIDGLNVIDDDTQIEMSYSVTSINVNIYFWDLITNSGSSLVDTAAMTYEISADIWLLDISDFAALLADRHKYVASIVKSSAEVANMRDFKLNEFSVDNDSLEDVWMRLPYEVVMTPTPKIVWYAVGDIGGTPLFEALAYQDGVGTTAATDPSRVTHRGEISAV